MSKNVTKVDTGNQLKEASKHYRKNPCQGKKCRCRIPPVVRNSIAITLINFFIN